jgi:glycosyltransferase involved in cell wall biosynthesis
METFHNDVELIVSDNQSTDDTASIVTELQQSFPYIRYHKQEKNLGADGNFLWCFENASGKHIWIFGDDDILLDGKLLHIISILKETEPDLMYISGYGYSGDNYIMEKPINPPLKKRPPYNIYQNPKAFLKRVHYFLTFTTGNIIRKDNLPKDFNATKFIGTNLIQLGWIIEAFINGSKFVYINELCLAAKTNNTGGYKLFDTFALQYDKILDCYTRQLSPDNYLKRITHFHLLLSFFPTFIHAFRKKHAGEFIQENPIQVLNKVYQRNIWFHLFLKPMIYLPATAATAYQKFVLATINKMLNAIH